MLIYLNLMIFNYKYHKQLNQYIYYFVLAETNVPLRYFIYLHHF